MAITSATENFALLKDADGVLGLGLTSDGNHYGNIIAFFKASGFIENDNFSFLIDTYDMTASQMNVGINISQYKHSMTSSIVQGFNDWAIPLLWSSIKEHP